jgi:hypothetical protein
MNESNLRKHLEAPLLKSSSELVKLGLYIIGQAYSIFG